MAREIDMNNFIAIGNGEPCPFCSQEDDRLVEDVFISTKDNDIMEHMMNEHPSELNKALFKEPPPKPWLEQPFQLVIAKIAARLKFLDEDDSELIPHEEFEETMHNMYGVLKDYFDNEND